MKRKRPPLLFLLQVVAKTGHVHVADTCYAPSQEVACREFRGRHPSLRGETHVVAKRWLPDA